MKARKRAYKAIQCISFEGMHYRRDIALKAAYYEDERGCSSKEIDVN
jgi:phosphoribosylamine-glycine ligase